VHGAIAGMTGQFTTNNTLENLYHEGGAGAESTAGNLPFTAAFAASVQSAEVVKIILGIGKTFEDEILIADLLNNELVIIPAK